MIRSIGVIARSRWESLTNSLGQKETKLGDLFVRKIAFFLKLSADDQVGRRHREFALGISDKLAWPVRNQAGGSFRQKKWIFLKIFCR